jgi:hypothetical protein
MIGCFDRRSAIGAMSGMARWFYAYPGLQPRCSLGEIMIGPPGLPKIGRRVFRFATSARPPSHDRLQPLKWVVGLYLAGVLAHFDHHMAFDLPEGIDPSFGEALTSAPTSLVWPADLIGTLMALS